MNASTIDLSIDNGLATLVMARPERKNALIPQMFAELLDALTDLRRNPEVRAVLLTGAGNDFCSGGDIGNMQGDYIEAANVRRRMEENNRLLMAMVDFDKPIIAAVDGAAYGAGFSIALAADFVIASERARFCMSFARLGLGPDLGASYTLPRIVGLQKAREIIFSAREVSAQEAQQLGIALEVHPADSFRARAQELARAMANLSPTAFSMTKRLLGVSLESDLLTMLDAEASNQAVSMASTYLKEAAGRFARKEAPLYQWPAAKRDNA
ncbi:enoyl-CoA hydratase/isomerase family protein [Pseudomonas sp. PSE14]|uniref:enoyl-CoA hydratase/isomerase family protein n=1 Tax=Pseudomonas sp. PSE14 TaxID=3016341 RepID=UPI0023D8A2A1|nr:enoyl-CoA hydratase/isomerase family protein [Pseudomonas sp. PSE14]WEJ74877.1 enoyl-CoA hydratase/isomerase family protein [Pseudomonas sp. PSE14]